MGFGILRLIVVFFGPPPPPHTHTLSPRWSHEAVLRDGTRERCESQHPERPPVWLALDQVVDPQNFGAILRTGYFFGVQGVVRCQRERLVSSRVPFFFFSLSQPETNTHTHKQRPFEPRGEQGKFRSHGSDEHLFHSQPWNLSHGIHVFLLLLAFCFCFCFLFCFVFCFVF